MSALFLIQYCRIVKVNGRNILSTVVILIATNNIAHVFAVVFLTAILFQLIGGIN
jgi:hypothetical protein